MDYKVPLSRVYMDEEIKNDVAEVLASNRYILGERTKKFEEAFAKLCQTKFCAATSSGTAAIFLTLKALGVGAGDEVIVPSFTFIATATPVLHVGAKPVFVDIDPETYTLDAAKLKKVVSPKTKAIIPVHLYGHPADMKLIIEVAKTNSIHVIEDACQAHGSSYNQKMIGSLGDAAVFSFYPSKNMTVCGDGGAVTTSDQELFSKVKMLRDHGRSEKYVHNQLGYNMRFNEIQAAVGYVQLQKLKGFNEARRRWAKQYTEALQDHVTTPVEKKWAYHVYHMYVLRHNRRDDLRKFLADKGVETGIHYPVPVHKQPAITEETQCSNWSLPNTEKAADTVVSLPMHPALTEEDVDYVSQAVIRFLKNA
ncbi:MAG: DegT/DnrJ/EryC1/StrS family aminotransferase [Thaumarchaeota archaeon]|nr:DegT/DnrJ/EryC1/StrS family aminotransferase [Nitrososphaerota archaeon]